MKCVLESYGLHAHQANRNSGNGNENGNGNKIGTEMKMGMKMETAMEKEVTIQEMALECHCTLFRKFENELWNLTVNGTGLVDYTQSFQELALLCLRMLPEKLIRRFVSMLLDKNAYEKTWKSLMKMMTEAYCLRNEIQKFENELWNLTVNGTGLVDYTQSFQELALLCLRML
nr:hypothetical protein [Tanacetum cinerariifolium]